MEYKLTKGFDAVVESRVLGCFDEVGESLAGWLVSRRLVLCTTGLVPSFILLEIVGLGDESTRTA